MCHLLSVQNVRSCRVLEHVFAHIYIYKMYNDVSDVLTTLINVHLLYLNKPVLVKISVILTWKRKGLVFVFLYISFNNSMKGQAV